MPVLHRESMFSPRAIGVASQQHIGGLGRHRVAPGLVLSDTPFRVHSCSHGRPLRCPLRATKRLSECSGSTGLDRRSGYVYIYERNDHQAAMIVGVERAFDDSRPIPSFTAARLGSRF